MAKAQFARRRWLAYYLGLALTAVGLVTFFLACVVAIWNFSDLSNYVAQVRGEGIRALAAMGMVLVGGALMVVGRVGWRGREAEPDAPRDV